MRVTRDGGVFEQRFARGLPEHELRRVADQEGHSGTMVTFLPDLEIFEEGRFDYDTLAHRIREMAFLTAGLEITLLDDRGETRSDTGSTTVASPSTCATSTRPRIRPTTR